ncbi:Zinc finger CCCH domain-containing protein [Drosera capensis]
MMKKELCRNFLRGNCRYGDKCKFLHSTQQQQQPRANPFGFGSQTGTPFQQTNTQQQKPNPFGFGTQTSAPSNTQQQNPNLFGFGVQNSSPSTGASNFGLQQTKTFKPFENKWTRSSSVAGTSSTPSQQQAKQSQAADHECTDPGACKRVIAKDFEQEKPLWKLTCYSHSKYLPCDITGDVSYEELRAVAYDEAKRGVNLQSIVERERSLLNSKLNEFQSLLHNPYSRRADPAPFPGAPSPLASTSAPPAVHPIPPSVSSFGQLGPSVNIGPAAPPNNAFPFQNPSQPVQTAVAIHPTTTPFAPSASNFFSQTSGSPFGSSLSFNSNSSNNQSSMLSSSFPASPQFTNFAVTQPSMLLNGPSHVGDGQKPALKPSESVQKVFSGDAAIWAKEKWNPGEIPEEAPPDEFIRSSIEVEKKAVVSDTISWQLTGSSFHLLQN